MNKFIHYGFVLLAIASICAAGLSFANQQTSPVIEKMIADKEMEARSQVFALAEKFVGDEKVAAEVDGIKLEYIPAYKADEKIGYVVSSVGPGYGGDVKIMLGIDLDGKVTGLTVTSALETPGLGDKILGSEWQDSWKGRDVNYEFRKEVDAFAGATISPMAVFTATKRALRGFNEKVIN